MYCRLVRKLSLEFNRIYDDRLIWANSPWDFQSIFERKIEAAKCIRRMRWCAIRHFLHLPGTNDASERAYLRALRLLNPPVSI